MEELNNTNVTETTETTDAFLDGWEDVSSDTAEAVKQPAEVVNEQNNVEKTETAAETQNQNVAQNGSSELIQPEGTVEEKQGTETQKDTSADLSWDIKVLDEKRTVKPDDITVELLQKGYDYDRVHTKWNEAKPVMEAMKQFADKAGMDVLSYVRYLREQVKISEGATEASAKHEVELEDKEATIKAREEAIALAEAESSKQAEAEKANKARIDKDVQEFKATFPDVYEKAKGDPKQIPQSVWDEVNKGATLSVAYAKYALAEANAKIKAQEEKFAIAEQNNKNAIRSTGSMRSAGDENATVDDFLKDW